MLLPRVPKYCRCLRHIGHVLLFVCLFTALNVLGYHYLYGPLTKPQILREMTMNLGQQILCNGSQHLSSSTIRASATRTLRVSVTARKETEKSIPDSTIPPSAETKGGSQALVAKATAESKLRATTLSRNTPLSTSLIRGLTHPYGKTSWTSFRTKNPTAFRTTKTTAARTNRVTLQNTQTTAVKTTNVTLQNTMNVTVTSAPARPPRNCGDIPFRTTNKTLQRFQPLLTGENLCRLLETTDAFQAALTRANVSFFMYGGTLIGSWRHHGFVPWDDDVDFAVDIDQRQLVYRRLMDLRPKFILDVKQKKRWKLYKAGSARIPRVTWKYPFLDINFFHHNATHVWDHDLHNYYMYVYPRHWVFPLSYRPFQGRWMPAPREVERSLTLTYKLNTCDTGLYNHRKEAKALAKRWTLPCQQLRPLLPFVERVVQTGAGCNETLLQGDRVLGSYYFDNAKCSRG